MNKTVDPAEVYSYLERLGAADYLTLAGYFRVKPSVMKNAIRGSGNMTLTKKGEADVADRKPLKITVFGPFV